MHRQHEDKKTDEKKKSMHRQHEDKKTDKKKRKSASGWVRANTMYMYVLAGDGNARGRCGMYQLKQLTVFS